MGNNVDYIKSLTKQKKKSVTITIDEKVLDDVTMIAEELNISRNQIISDTTANFVEDYKKWQNPKYYIINSNYTYMPDGHLHMLLGNRASAWGDTKTAIDNMEPGSYVFIYLNEHGIVGAGTIESTYQVNDYCLVKYHDKFGVADEHFVKVAFDKTSLNADNTINDSSVVTAKMFKEHVSNKVLNRTKVELSTQEGEKLKKLYVG
ncbi:TusA-related sulfurtransferase [Salirhabdus euzebyi]|uniref:TusA-related sulfurtransferase n=1 Tax=Salirhabdus euzebyi TaxID=394506 RepID=A0A841PXW2_9BACI|nr:hypothetical protein [Salirhabdus euzebyi]MBB6451631.1 TusA-related sulfurtransferase [Salirhabdus euzebyi]